MKFFKILSGLFATTLVAQTGFANQPNEQFSYCSDGMCRLITTNFFYQGRGMPLDTNFSCIKNNQYAMTFDDGPSKNYPKLIEILKKHNVKATFFVNGKNAESPEASEWLGQIAHAGHFVANHTYNHPDLTALSDEEIYDQLERSRQILLNSPDVQNLTPELKAQLEKSTKYLRPPFGNVDLKVDKVFKEHGYINVRWNSDKYDWNMPNEPETVKVIVDRVKAHLTYIDNLKSRGVDFNQSILDLNHDWQDQTLAAVDEYIPLLKAHGYEFVTMDECLGN